MITYVGMLTVKSGKREEYLKKILDSGMLEEFRQQGGYIFYQVAASATDPDVITVMDGWKDMAAFHAHDQSEVVDSTWRPLYAEYVVSNEHYLMTEV